MNKKTVCSLLLALLTAVLLLAACQRDPSVHPDGGVHSNAQPGTNPLAGVPPADAVVIENSGVLVTQEYENTGFSKLEISTFDVDIRQGDSFRVLIEVEQNLLDYIQVKQTSETLKLGIDPDNTYHMVGVVSRAEITMPVLTGLVLDNGSQTTIAGFKSAEDLEIVLNLASTLNGSLEAGDIQFDVSLGSEAVLSGSAGNITVVAEGSVLNLSQLEVDNAIVEAELGSLVTVNASGRLDVEASGAEVYYLGQPILGKVSADLTASVEEK